MRSTPCRKWRRAKTTASPTGSEYEKQSHVCGHAIPPSGRASPCPLPIPTRLTCNWPLPPSAAHTHPVLEKYLPKPLFKTRLKSFISDLSFSLPPQKRLQFNCYFYDDFSNSVPASPLPPPWALEWNYVGNYYFFSHWLTVTLRSRRRRRETCSTTTTQRGTRREIMKEKNDATCRIFQTSSQTKLRGVGRAKNTWQFQLIFHASYFHTRSLFVYNRLPWWAKKSWASWRGRTRETIKLLKLNSRIKTKFFLKKILATTWPRPFWTKWTWSRWLWTQSQRCRWNIKFC